MPASSRHVALLRGINVGRAKRIAMADLRALVEDLGFRDVRTVLNSGNVVYTSPRTAPKAAAARIEKAIADTLGVSSRVVVLDGIELSGSVDRNPLVRVADNHSRLLMYVAASSDALAKAHALTTQSWGTDKVAIDGRFLYAWCSGGILASPLREAIDRALKDTVTSRNWATVLKLSALAQEGT